MMCSGRTGVKTRSIRAIRGDSDHGTEDSAGSTGRLLPQIKCPITRRRVESPVPGVKTKRLLDFHLFSRAADPKGQYKRAPLLEQVGVLDSIPAERNALNGYHGVSIWTCARKAFRSRLEMLPAIVMECIIETKANMMLQFIEALRGDALVTFEEGTWAAWL
jgi:hypothetical protein